MPFVLTRGELADVQPAWWPTHSYGRLQLYNDYSYDYAAIYRTQPNVRTCVDFLARNIAQLGLHVFRRVSDTDRERLREHALARVIAQPLPREYKVTRYRLISSLVSDLAIYDNAYWLMVTGPQLGLLRIPPPYVHVKGGLMPEAYEIRLQGKTIKIPREEIVHFHGYNADSGIVGLSPLETLRRILAEEHAAGTYREHFWRNAARMHGIITRPAGAPEWTPTARQRFKAEFEALYSGAEASGRTAILEEGMEWQVAQFNAQESEYLAGRKLTREECTRAYHIPLPLVGILDHATFSNIEAQHKHLYQDSLGPWLAMIQEEIDLQLLPRLGDADGVYCEFNIAEKLKGDFGEQTAALQSAVGRPWMTANEARARMNLPSVEDGDDLVTPLNVLVGGMASPRDAAPGKERSPLAETRHREEKARALDSYVPEMREAYEAKAREVLSRYYRRQEAAIVSRVPDALIELNEDGKAMVGSVWFDEERWARELRADLFKLNLLVAGAWGLLLLKRLDVEVDETAFEAGMTAWLDEHSRVQAAYINDQVRDELEAALTGPDPRNAVKGLFATAVAVWAVRQAVGVVTAASNFGASEGARAGGLRTKTWHVNSNNPRDSHAALNGVTVGIRESFPNGLRWPGDSRGSAEENANCQCSVEFGT
jgi:HK97 family phage portal protein